MFTHTTCIRTLCLSASTLVAAAAVVAAAVVVVHHIEVNRAHTAEQGVDSQRSLDYLNSMRSLFSIAV